MMIGKILSMPKKAWHLIFAVLFSLVVMFCIWRAPFGYCTVDESLYLSVPYRMLQGDALLVHEWHITQMNAFIIYPLLKIYLLIAGTTDGIVLSFRYIYTFFHSLVALFIYIKLSRLKKTEGCIAGIIAAILYEFYCYGNYIALSYNTIPIGLMTVCALIFSCSEHFSVWNYLLAGFAMMASVLCSPYLILLYIIYSALVWLKPLNRKTGLCSVSFSRKAWLIVSAICALGVILFFIPIIRSGKIAELPTFVAQIFAVSEHPPRTAFQIIWGYLASIVLFRDYCLPAALLALLLMIVIIADKKRVHHRRIYIVCAMADCFFYAWTFLAMYRFCDAFVFAVTMLGVFSYSLLEKREKHLFVFDFLPAVIYSFCSVSSSDRGTASLMSGFAMSLPAVVYFTVCLITELLQAQREKTFGWRAVDIICAAGLIGLTSVFGCAMLYTRMSAVAADSPPAELNAQFEYGASKGLKSTPEKVAEIDGLYESLAPVREIKEGNVLYLTRENRLYLEDSKKCSSYSMWYTAYLQTQGIEWLEQYWALNPEKRPDYIYIREQDLEEGTYLSHFDEQHYERTKLEQGMLLSAK